MNVSRIRLPGWITRVRERTVNTQLVLYGLVLYVPVLILCILLGTQYVKHEEADTIHDALEAARNIGSTTSAYVESLTLTARILAASKTIYDDDIAGFDRRIRTTPIPESASVILVRADGQQLINTYLPSGSVLPNSMPDKVAQVFSTGKPALSDVILGAVRKEFVVVAAVPVFKGAEIPYVLEMIVPVSYFHKIVALLTPNWRCVLFDSQGVIISRWNDQGVGHRVSTWDQIKNIPPGTEHAYDAGSQTIEGRSIQGGVRHMENGWYVGVTAPPDVFEEPARAFFRYALCFFVYFLLLPIIAAWFMGIPIRSALTQLTVKARALSLGLVVEPPMTAIKEVNVANRIMYDAALNLKRSAEQTEMLVSTLDQSLGLPKSP